MIDISITENKDLAFLMKQDAPAVIAVSEPAIDKALKSLQNAILSHMVVGALKTSSIEDEQLLETGSPEDTTIRINYFSKPEKVSMKVKK